MDKAELRRQIRDLGPVDPHLGQLVAEQLFGWAAPRLPGTAAAYLAMADEVSVDALFTLLPGWRWLLPRVEDDCSLSFWDRDLERETHRWGMDQPVASGDPVALREIDLILVPGMAFDPSGSRLGRGKGYYDRILEHRRGDCVAVGVTLSARVCDQVPSEPHDRRVDYLATEAGVLDCSGAHGVPPTRYGR